ncbi:universal stress protein [Halorubrum cibi]|uniref:Universal stress protein family protein n=1 Tax=Halorubrum cibi TaxID=413815 RepID=A0A521DT50_9EURY|nr:universal stress protein [Halorubrum cibi]SMO74933.1 Universal stress protein family protein [Halorubrum cibi]
MTDTILVPVELPDPEPIAPVLVRDLASLDIVVLGHFAVPEQTPREAAREQFEGEAQATLDAIAEPFREASRSVRTRLVFGKDRATAIDRVMLEEDCAAELNPAPTEGIDRILVPIPAVAEFSRLPAFVNVLCEDSTREVTLFHVAEGGESRKRAESIVEETREGMIEAGLDADLVDTRVVEGEEHDEEILRLADEYDAVVMYQAESRLGDRIFGTLPDRIADRTGDPVIVVRRDYEPEESTDGEAEST